jgi:hypothetical protein
MWCRPEQVLTLCWLLAFSFSMEPGYFLVWNVRGLNSRAKRDSVK